MNIENKSVWVSVAIAALSSILMHFMFFIKILGENKTNAVIIILALVPILVIAYAIAMWFESRPVKY